MPKKPSTIFVGSMSDIEYWDKQDTQIVIGICNRNSKHTFMFLSKNPLAYSSFEWPHNTMQGLTMTLAQTRQCQEENFEQMLKYPRPFLSFEPLLGALKTRIWSNRHDKEGFELVICGPMTGTGAIQPWPGWIETVKHLVCGPVYWKKNKKNPDWWKE
jgi:protein gp37